MTSIQLWTMERQTLKWEKHNSRIPQTSGALHCHQFANSQPVWSQICPKLLRVIQAFSPIKSQFIVHNSLKINHFSFVFIIHNIPIVYQKINLSSFLSIYQEEDYVHKLKGCPNCINSCHQQIMRWYKRCAIPQADQAVQERINIWQPWEHFCWPISDNSPKCRSTVQNRTRVVIINEKIHKQQFLLSSIIVKKCPL